MTTQSPRQLSIIYDQDFYLWLETTAKLLQEGKVSELDLPNLIEEILDMGKSQKHSLKSNLRVILMHLLKYKYQPEKRTNSWRLTIFEHRKRLEDTFEDSPSLKRYFLEVFNNCYQDARQEAAIETGLPLLTFPPESPFSFSETFDLDYLPETGNVAD